MKSRMKKESKGERKKNTNEGISERMDQEKIVQKLVFVCNSKVYM